jgi:hypothetical protein
MWEPSSYLALPCPVRVGIHTKFGSEPLPRLLVCRKSRAAAGVVLGDQISQLNDQILGLTGAEGHVEQLLQPRQPKFDEPGCRGGDRRCGWHVSKGRAVPQPIRLT